MRFSVLLLQLRVFLVWVVFRQKQLFRMMHFWHIASNVQYNMMPCANAGSQPWYCCGCTDDTLCRPGDVGSMTFLPWFVPRTEPPVQLREVGPDGRHLLTVVAATFTFLYVDVEPGMRTAAAVTWEAAAKMSLLVLALSVLDRGCCSSVYCSNTGCCSSTCCCCCCCCGRCTITRRWWSTRSHPTESLVDQVV